MSVGLQYRALACLVCIFLLVPWVSPPPAGATGTRYLSASVVGKSKVPVRCKKRVKAKGTVKYSDWQFPDTLNPFQASASVDSETYDGMFEQLTDYNNKVQLVPVLLTRVPSIKNGDIQNGGKTIVLHLNKGMLWSTGSEITAQDVKFGWQVAMDTATGPSCKGTCDVISRIDLKDKYTAVIHMKTVYSPAIPNAIGFYPWPHNLPGVWTDVHTAALRMAQDQKYKFDGPDYPTDGPYQVVQFAQNDRIVLHPMKYYNVMSCGAPIAELIFAFYSSKPGMIAAAVNRDTDQTTNYTPADLPDLQKHPEAYKVFSIPSYNYEHIEFNIDPTYKGAPNPLHDVNVRLALALSLDRIGLTESALGLSEAAARAIVGWTPWINTPHLVAPFTDKSIKGQWDPIQKKYVIPGRGKALDDAKKLLAKTQWKDGFSIDVVTTTANPTRASEVSVVANNWGAIGVKVNPIFIQSTIYFADYGKSGTLHNGAFQACIFTSTLKPDFNDINLRLGSQYIDREASVKSSINYNYSGIHDVQMDKDFSKATHTYDAKLRFKYYSDVQKRVNQQAYWIVFYFRPFVTTADGRLKGYNPSPISAGWNKYGWSSGNS